MDGRVALVTGGSRGLGRAMAEAFARAGADIAIVARRPEVLEETRAALAAQVGTEVRAYVCDVADPAAITAAFTHVLEDFGRVDVLVNNAGSSFNASVLECTDAEWQHDLDVKLFAMIRFSRLAIPGMRERRWGRILNVINAGAKVPRAGGAPTQVSRAAQLALTKITANEHAADGILVNALIPATVVTDQVAGRHAREAPDVAFEDYLADLGSRLPMGRMGTAQEFANVACFLASDAGSYVTGTVINVDGGQTPVP